MGLEPDDTVHGAWKYLCAVPDAVSGKPCNAPTGRRIGTGQVPVCQKHFIQGWGRVPNMPLPGQEPEEPKNASSATLVLRTYHCDKCGRAHTFTSKIGKRHFRYRR